MSQDVCPSFYHRESESDEREAGRIGRIRGGPAKIRERREYTKVPGKILENDTLICGRVFNMYRYIVHRNRRLFALEFLDFNCDSV